jgi:S-adenosylmethionine synthetase
MNRIIVESVAGTPTIRRRFEHVERKGIGHPDTICDGVAEAVSTALSRTYRELCGQVLHHNADKALLAAGRSSPCLGGGTVDAPMRLFLGDRATAVVGGKTIPVDEIAEAAARDWLRRNLRFVEVDRHLDVRSVLRQGSAELTGIFHALEVGANDTSIGVGCAPLTETERLTLSTERRLNSPDWKRRHPELGEDVKVMAVRIDRRISLTVAAAMVDRFLPNAAAYFARKAEIADELRSELATELVDCDALELALNALDDPSRGEDGMYLSVTGTSAEGADSGQVGRGNRANGLISPHRAMSLEAVAGKNPISHVGKIYNVLALQAARRIVAEIDAVAEATVWICSRIGRPLAEPWSVAVELVPQERTLGDVSSSVESIIEGELRRLPDLIERLSRSEIAVY